MRQIMTAERLATVANLDTAHELGPELANGGRLHPLEELFSGDLLPRTARHSETLEQGAPQSGDGGGVAHEDGCGRRRQVVHVELDIDSPGRFLQAVPDHRIVPKIR